MRANKWLNFILTGVILIIVIMFIRIPIRQKEECQKKINLQEIIFDNILEGQKFIAEYKPKLNKYFTAYWDTIASKRCWKDKIILRVSENSCHSCIEAIKLVIAERFDFKDFVLLTSYRNDNLANRIELFHSFPYRINLENLSEKIGDQDINFIYCFKIDSDQKIRDMFVPVKEIQIYNRNGFEILLSD